MNDKKAATALVQGKAVKPADFLDTCRFVMVEGRDTLRVIRVNGQEEVIVSATDVVNVRNYLYDHPELRGGVLGIDWEAEEQRRAEKRRKRQAKRESDGR